VVAIGNDVDLNEIDAMAGRNGSPSQNYVYRVPENSMIDEVADALVSALCAL
jgi:hypothetical protein